MRAWGLGAMRKREDGGFPATPLPNERTVTMICVTRPAKVLDELADVLGFVATAEAGVYHCNQALPQWIIHPTELAVIPKNYPLLPLARGAKLEEFIDYCLQAGLTDYLQLVVDVGLATDPEVIWRKLMEAQEMKMVISEETWPYIDQFFREMPEALQKLPSFRDALDESKAEGEAEGVLHTQRQTLLHILRHKFGELPEHVTQRIAETGDRTQLVRWLDQALDATTLAELTLA